MNRVKFIAFSVFDADLKAVYKAREGIEAPTCFCITAEGIFV